MDDGSEAQVVLVGGFDDLPDGRFVGDGDGAAGGVDE